MSLTKVTYSMIAGSPANVLDFGADPTGATNSATAIGLALNSGAGVVVFPPGIYKMQGGVIVTNTALKRIEGYGATLRADIGGTTNVYMLDTGTNDIQVSIVGLTFDALNPATTQHELWWGGTFSYQYRNYNAGVYVPDGSVVEDCVFKQLFDALYIGTNSGFPFDRSTKVLNNRFEENFKTCQLILCNFAEFSGNTAYLGSEVTFPSCRNLTITNNTMFLPGTPAIDVGGSAAAAGTQVIIADNISYGRDPIVVENGFDDIIISNNQCYTTSDTPNGVGIGVTTNTLGQEINRVVINGNKISRYNDPYGTGQAAFGILVDVNIDVAVRDIQIEGNQISTVGTGIAVEGFDATPRINGVSIRNNTVREVRTNGIVVGYADRVHISDNMLVSDTSVSGSKGIYLNNIVRGRIRDNVTLSFITNHYYFDEVQSDVLLDNPDHNATTEALLWGFGTVTGNLVCRNVVFPTSATPAIGSWSQGSFIINPLPASAGFQGATCTVTGTPGTWRTYGLIS
jgi:hypothetical protein